MDNPPSCFSLVESITGTGTIKVLNNVSMVYRLIMDYTLSSRNRMQDSLFRFAIFNSFNVTYFLIFATATPLFPRFCALWFDANPS